jgi:D-tyrosyl-tRNA(Tyr) deacylase
MKALIQRVTRAEVSIEGKLHSKIGKGCLVFLGIEKGDTEWDIAYIGKKIAQLRIFEDASQKMNFSVKDINGEILVVSQFTLSAQCRKGNRPSFDCAEEQTRAEVIYKKFINTLKTHDLRVQTGDFGAYMQIYLINDGPVTLLLDSKK